MIRENYKLALKVEDGKYTILTNVLYEAATTPSDLIGFDTEEAMNKYISDEGLVPAEKID
jgi:hypothetical protein